jgi:hypothetical protein
MSVIIFGQREAEPFLSRRSKISSMVALNRLKLLSLLSSSTIISVNREKCNLSELFMMSSLVVGSVVSHFCTDKN